MKKDEETAESVFSGAVLAPNVAMHQIRTLLNSADVFSGDVLLSAYTPAGDLNVILGDFTGHGLAAAIGALPASEVFRAMTNKGFSPQQILAGINRKLHRLLPTSMFFAVQFVSVSNSLKHVTVCNCGMPDVLLVDGKRNAIKHRFLSRCLPLSILPDIDFQEATEHFVIKPGDQILLMSDGVLEARNPDQDYFGQSRLDRALRETADPTRLLDGISESLARFRQDAPKTMISAWPSSPVSPQYSTGTLNGIDHWTLTRTQL